MTVEAAARGAPATLRVRQHSGTVRVFHADSCRIDWGLTTATGRWARNGRTETYTWPRTAIREIRWHGTAVVA